RATEISRELAQRRQFGAAADQTELDIVPVHRVHDVLHGGEQSVDALLAAHHPDIADQITSTVLERRRWRQHAQATQIRPAAYDEDLGGRALAALDRNLAVGLVGRDAHVGGLERAALEPEHQAVEQIAALELRFVQLGIDVVMIEQEFLAEQLVEAADQEQRIGRIARVDRVEAALHQYAQR